MWLHPKWMLSTKFHLIIVYLTMSSTTVTMKTYNSVKILSYRQCGIAINHVFPQVYNIGYSYYNVCRYPPTICDTTYFKMIYDATKSLGFIKFERILTSNPFIIYKSGIKHILVVFLFTLLKKYCYPPNDWMKPTLRNGFWGFTWLLMWMHQINDDTIVQSWISRQLKNFGLKPLWLSTKCKNIVLLNYMW